MTTRTTATALVLLAAALTACTSTDPAPEKTTTTAPALSQAEITEQCIDAIAAAINNRPADFDPENDTDPVPTECEALPEDDYLDAYMDGLDQSNTAP